MIIMLAERPATQFDSRVFGHSKLTQHSLMLCLLFAGICHLALEVVPPGSIRECGRLRNQIH